MRGITAQPSPACGEVFVAPFDIVFTKFDIVEPDVLFVAGAQADIVTEKHVRGAPALVVEIFSPGTRRVDENVKYRLFERTGVREYWLVDPELDLIKVFRRAVDVAFPRVAELTAEAAHTLETPLLPEFALALARLFR
jgi:Uma2 family endonuclease